MKRAFIHLSDLHFSDNWEENQELVLAEFFKDLQVQLKETSPEDRFLIFSGDVVHAGGNALLYENFYELFNEQLLHLGIGKNQRICVPGNHDVSQGYIKSKFEEHEGVVNLSLTESKFNNYISKPDNVLVGKFDVYKSFESRFSDHGVKGNLLSGEGFTINGIGIYCLNTAMCSSGGHEGVKDFERLCIDTRRLQQWVLSNKTETKILVMHHPKEWLTPWSKIEIEKLIKKHFQLCLSGHVHDQNLYHSISQEKRVIECSAPPLLTNKSEKLGYAIISVSPDGVNEIRYRQWTRNHTFVSGVDFSNTDTGNVVIRQDALNGDTSTQVIEKAVFISNELERRFTQSLCSFSSQPKVWVDPVLCKTNELSQKATDNEDSKVTTASIIHKPYSVMIKAPALFGLTCLSHYLIKEAWKTRTKFWLYLDAYDVKANAVEKSVAKALATFNVNINFVECIVLDSWAIHEKDAFRLLKNLSESYKNIPIIVMQTIDETKFHTEPNNEIIEREFSVLHLLALPRGHVRQVVSAYNKEKNIGEEDIVLAKVVSDLEVLNMPRTPINILTLLKVAEKHFDESPVNRTKVVENVLQLIFNSEKIPTYKRRPDVKDCEHVLGRFCERMIRDHAYSFSREDFIKEIRGYCEEKYVDIEIEILFDVLMKNYIIIRRDGNFTFRSTYWVFYFGAQRMHSDPDFAYYILDKKRYPSFPEIIEFYTGIDRSRTDALKMLISDIRETRNTVFNKVALPADINPYKTITWTPTNEILAKMHQELGDDVAKSNLPDSVKDQYADKSYDQQKPYTQTIGRILEEYSVVQLMQKIKASSRALRNSDYVDPSIKREILEEIIKSWEQIATVLLALAPVLAAHGHAKFEGAGFTLAGDFGATQEERVNLIIQNTPFNVVKFFMDDLFSGKMGPLLFKHFEEEKNEIRKHKLSLFLAIQRPHGWRKIIESHISKLPLNSFYLYDLVSTLQTQYRYSFATPTELAEMRYLIKLGLAKHVLKINKPTVDSIKKIKDQGVIPRREYDDEAEIKVAPFKDKAAENSTD